MSNTPETSGRNDLPYITASFIVVLLTLFAIAELRNLDMTSWVLNGISLGITIYLGITLVRVVFSRDLAPETPKESASAQSAANGSAKTAEVLSSPESKKNNGDQSTVAPINSVKENMNV